MLLEVDSFMRGLRAVLLAVADGTGMVGESKIGDAGNGDLEGPMGERKFVEIGVEIDVGEVGSPGEVGIGCDTVEIDGVVEIVAGNMLIREVKVQ